MYKLIPSEIKSSCGLKFADSYMHKLIDSTWFLLKLYWQFYLKSSQFSAFLKATADNSHRITILYSNFAAIKLTLNLVRHCQQLNMNNIGIICLDKATQQQFNQLNIPTFLLQNPNNQHKFTVYGTNDFFYLTLQKIFCLHKVLTWGYHLLFIDSDIVLLQNPYPYFKGQYDIFIQSDLTTIKDFQHNRFANLNTGFMFIKSNSKTKKLFAQLLLSSLKSAEYLNDQVYFNQIIESRHTKVSIQVLPQLQFVNGTLYWQPENGYQGEFDQLPKNKQAQNKIVMIHNNWIEGLSAKINRFKKSGLWLLD